MTEQHRQTPPEDRKRLPNRWAIIIAATIAAFACCYSQGVDVALTVSIAIVAVLHSVLE